MESSTLFAPAGGEPFAMRPATAEEVTAAFVAQCKADKAGDSLRALCSQVVEGDWVSRTTVMAVAGTTREVLRRLNLSALLEPPEAGSEEGASCEG